MTDAVWEFNKIRMDVLREQYTNGDMDEGVLRERLKLIGFAEPWLSAEVKHCNELFLRSLFGGLDKRT